MNLERMKAAYAAKKIELKTAFDEYMAAENRAEEARKSRQESFARLCEGRVLGVLVGEEVLASANRRVLETGIKFDMVSREVGDLLTRLNAPRPNRADISN